MYKLWERPPGREQHAIIRGRVAAPTALSWLIALILITPIAQALDSLALNIGTLAGTQWKLESINITLIDLTRTPQQLALTIAKLSLPKPFDDLNLANIRCTDFTWQNQALNCKQGRADIRSKRWQSPSTDFSFQVTQQRSTFTLSNLQLAGGRIKITGEEQGERWQLRINAKAVEGRLLQQLLPLSGFELKTGKIDVKLQVSGSGGQVDAFILKAGLHGLTGQSEDGRFASEDLVLVSTVSGQYHNGLWQWQSHVEMNGGALYVEPLFLEAAGQEVALNAQGSWDAVNKQIDISSASYWHATIGELSGSATIRYRQGISLEQAALSLNSFNLQGLSETYLKPFLEQSALQGLRLSGHVKAKFSIHQQALSAWTASFNNLGLNDASSRVQIQGGAGTLNWSSDERLDQLSEFSWQRLQIGAIPIGSAKMSLSSRTDSIRLLNKIQLPVLGGSIAINHFSWQAKKQQEPEVSFEGSINKLSLEQLSAALDWTPLSGTISGPIPRVEYSNKTLSLGGELVIKVFDGEIKVSNLASSGLFTDFPKLHGDLEIDNLDLDQLTRRFEFGGITGRLSGYVRHLYMENWQPVTFFSWLGTPENDNSRRRISQKAVKNIASIGGGGASDLLSRSFLSFFETFGYDKLGLGCYLHDGVCQLMGVEALESGYVIISGGGLPRIDVIGYNSRVDWDVLIERLKRITTSEPSVSY
ncbi:MAG: C4-dicarboxylate ABC transporter [Methylobacter sp.]|nr:C4-dicarboxylate ABC transporter [Methylobacter sp.]MDP2429493.1 C4-dicarboxylate ABC transporter [Methylobacter sp.]MDP3055804.1 C4-dicarboxylate ABC transporter [Methylobacter sp.]